MYRYSLEEQQKHPHFAFCEWAFINGWKTIPSYGPPTYDEELPKSSGVYMFVLDDLRYGIQKEKSKILYIGKSRNLVKRHKQHEIIPIIYNDYVRGDYCLCLWFKKLDVKLIDEEEKILIGRYNPPYNLIYRKKGIVSDGNYMIEESI